MKKTYYSPDYNTTNYEQFQIDRYGFFERDGYQFFPAPIVRSKPGIDADCTDFSDAAQQMESEIQEQKINDHFDNEILELNS
jgi:hypothetical protein